MHRARSDNNLMVQTQPSSSEFAPVSHQTAFFLVVKCEMWPSASKHSRSRSSRERNEVIWQRASRWSFSLQEWCRFYKCNFPDCERYKFDFGRERRSYNCLSVYIPVFKRGSNVPGGCGIFICLSKHLSRLSEIEWSSGYEYCLLLTRFCVYCGKSWVRTEADW